MESNPTPNPHTARNPDLAVSVNALISGQPRQFEKLSPALLDQFSSKADLYSYMKEHLQVSNNIIITIFSLVLHDALRHVHQGCTQGHLC